MQAKQQIIAACQELLIAKENGLLGKCDMPEDSSPTFSIKEHEDRLAYFSLPMALNYQRDSFKLWEAALKTWQDPETKRVFSTEWSAKAKADTLRANLSKYKLALQPNKHIETWQRISQTIESHIGSFQQLFQLVDNDFLKLRALIQKEHKTGFPYLSGPKIFNYWSFIIQEYGGINLKHSDSISIAPDTHIIQCSVRLGLITTGEADKLSRETIAERWKEVLQDSGLAPIRIHPALWFWSRSGFAYKLSGS